VWMPGRGPDVSPADIPDAGRNSDPQAPSSRHRTSPTSLLREPSAIVIIRRNRGRVLL
jgi:hypothetical protein